MSPTDKRKLERVRYWQGQMLRSRDFNDIHAVEEQRRWWHNRALHNAYGIHVDGQDDPALPAPGAFHVDFADSGKTKLIVRAGLAYDNFGRELILENDQMLKVPPLAADQTLVLLARYNAGAPKENSSPPIGTCWTSSGVNTSGLVDFVWQAKESGCSTGSFTDGIPLAELQIYKEQPKLALANLPSTRPLARPLIGSGSTVPGNTPWTLWSSEFDFFRRTRREYVFGVQTVIDTAATGFTDAPSYFAWLQGPIWNPQTRQLVPALFTSVADEAVDRFTFRIVLPSTRQGSTQFAATTHQDVQNVTAEEFVEHFAHEQNLYVGWVGCQKNVSVPVHESLQLYRNFGLNIPSAFRNIRDLSALGAALSRQNQLS